MSEYKVYAKLQEARIRLQAAPLKKSGHNKFAGYQYFELGDFLPTINQIFNDLGLCSIVSFGSEMATLRIVDTEHGGTIVLTSPMAEANLKRCHPIQNLGAVETYTRRYLYVTALEIVEHDALDATTGADEPKSAKSVSKDVYDQMDDADKKVIEEIASEVRWLLEKGDDAGAVEYINNCELDADWKTALWSRLDSKQRSAIKKITTR